jgi:Glutamate/Leucine/Phenylalanine/Valine dehydrogenase
MIISSVQADVFVPAGGRPGTLNKDNWKGYLSAPGGTASSPLIVEGANLFVSTYSMHTSMTKLATSVSYRLLV